MKSGTEFHIARDPRERYALADAPVSPEGHVVLAGFAATRALAQRMNARRDLVRDPASTVHAAELEAMGLLGEILHYVLEQQRGPSAALHARALAALEEQLGRAQVDVLLGTYAAAFPTEAVYRGEEGAAAYLSGETEGIANRQIVLEELLLLTVAQENPAIGPLRELLEDPRLRDEPVFATVLPTLERFYRDETEGVGPAGEDLLSLLRAPARAAPGSLAEQLRFIRERWGVDITEYMDRVLRTLGVLQEEERALWQRFNPHAHGDSATAGDRAPGSMLGVGTAAEEEPEAFSADLDWMPSLVLIAKSTYVWLDQLSRKHGRPIRRLDEIPDEELDGLARAGFTGLWLIGLWERSRASQRIKQLRGNPEAVASAYSLFDYRISADLGGEEAYAVLRDRAWQRGVRLASDMVPNHMGIDSRWVVEHPEWFLALGESPYPSYSFNGPNLSADERVGVYLEDHYWDGTDAAVVFKRVDRWSGEERYIYHGNDGTSMPWNDTAQLDYLQAQVREGVIQTILHVARQFPIIRFDAAMTLAKRHVQRLWYPEPGAGGAIPSRAEHAITREEFEAAMPAEFWREVVDRVAAEVPDTLLLAEAFWLMEGYFVRTLGMHRVYNSAFMHMTRDEDNAGYRKLIRETLEFDPEILKRYVNFMSNPDERTAIDQFGDGDKYAGVATLLATLPGLPMISHGQVEGFGERYGMEFRRAKLDEQPREWLVARHEREIFPLLHRRRMFAEAQDFLLYDFVTPDGSVDENVFAYSNGTGDQPTLVVYHNRYASTRGTIRVSVPYRVKDGEGEGSLVTRTLGEGLGISGDGFVVLCDHRAGQEYLRRAADVLKDGLYLELDAYACRVFLSIEQVPDADGRHARLAARLGGSPTPSVVESLVEMDLEPLHAAFRQLLTTARIAVLVGEAGTEDPSTIDAAEVGAGAGVPVDAVVEPLRAVLGEVAALTGVPVDTDRLVEQYAAELARVFPVARRGAPPSVTEAGSDVVAGAAAAGAASPDVAAPGAASRSVAIRELLGEGPATVPTLDAWLIARVVTDAVPGEGSPRRRLAGWVAAWRLGRLLTDDMRRAVGVDDAEAAAAPGIVSLLLTPPDTDAADTEDYAAVVRDWLRDDRVLALVADHEYEGVRYFEKERFERVVRWLAVRPVLEALVGDADDARVGDLLSTAAATVETASRLAEASGYRTTVLLGDVETATPAAGGAPDEDASEAGDGPAEVAPAPAP